MHAWECRRRDRLFTICLEYSFRSGCEPVRGTDEKLRRWSVRERRGSGDEAAADANRVFTKLLGPHAFEIHANGWKDWHGKSGLRCGGYFNRWFRRRNGRLGCGGPGCWWLAWSICSGRFRTRRGGFGVCPAVVVLFCAIEAFVGNAN